jgi:hypothetical protein
MVCVRVYVGSLYVPLDVIVSALADRIQIMRGLKWNSQPNLALQVLLNCGNAGTCHGGSPDAAYQYVRENGIPDETCQVYEADDRTCEPDHICENCSPSGGVCPGIIHGSNVDGKWNSSHWLSLSFVIHVVCS